MANDFASFRFTSGMEVWVADEKECWVRGVVTESQGDTLKVRKGSNKSEVAITIGPNIERELLPANLPQNTNIPDIIKTEYLHEASLLETLRVRHSNATSSSSSGIACEEIYTYAGPVLLSCNPYKRLDIYGPDTMHRYSATMEQVPPPPPAFLLSALLTLPFDQFTMDHHHVGTLHEHPDDENSRLPPHVFCIAQDAYSNVLVCVHTSRIAARFYTRPLHPSNSLQQQRSLIRHCHHWRIGGG
jgi:myosin heavy subunit